MSIRQSHLRVAILGFSVAIFTVVGASVGQARDAVCAPAEAQRAESEAETIRTWDALYVSFGRYRQCDDGAIAEGYSESVARIFVDRWGTLNRLAVLRDKNRAFRRFVIRHVDSTAGAEDLEKIELLAKTQCAKGLEALCDELGKRAHSALQSVSPLK